METVLVVLKTTTVTSDKTVLSVQMMLNSQALLGVLDKVVFARRDTHGTALRVRV